MLVPAQWHSQYSVTVYDDGVLCLIFSSPELLGSQGELIGWP